MTIAIGDWLLARSEAFKLLMGKFRDHQITTKNSFTRVKQKHEEIDDTLETQQTKLRSHEVRIRELEEVLESLKEVEAGETSYRLKRKRK